MTYIEPDAAPEIPTPDPGQPEIDPGASPDEMPPLDPGGGEEGDSRPHDQAWS